MAILNVIIKGRTEIIFGVALIFFIRNEQSTKDAVISYANGSGQSLIAGQILYTSGLNGFSGFLEVKVKTNVILNGNGFVTLEVTRFPEIDEISSSLLFNYDGSEIRLSFEYNSRPATDDIRLETPNRTPKNFSVIDFTSKYSDYDNNAIYEVAIFGDVTGYFYNGIPYIAGTYFNVVTSPILVYNPLDQNPEYDKDNTWSAKDSNGILSVNSANLKIVVLESEIELLIDVYERNFTSSEFEITQGTNNTYALAKQEFDSADQQLMSGILFVFNKTSGEIVSLKATNPLKVICNLTTALYANQIRKIKVDTVLNEYKYPNGGNLLYPDKIIDSSIASIGSSGEFYFGTKTTPDDIALSSTVYPLVSVIADDTTIPLNAKLYTPINFTNGFKAISRELSFNVSLLDVNNIPIVIKVNDYALNPSTDDNKFNVDLNIGNKVYEDFYEESGLETVGLYNRPFPIFPSGALGQETIKIKSLPAYGDLYLDGVIVILDQVISVLDLELNLFFYTPATFGNKDFFSFTTSGTGVTTDYRTFYLELT